MARHGPTFGQRRPAPKPRPVKGEVIMDDATRRKVRRFRFRRLVTFLALVGVIAGAIGLYISPLTRVQHVQVTGTSVLDPQQVAELTDAEGQSMFTLSFADAEERIAALPGVKAVRIERQFPQTLRVVVTERQPWGAWVSGDVTYVIDDEGIVIDGATAPVGSAVIHATDGTATLVGGDHVDTDAVALTRQLMEQVPARLAQYVTWIEWNEAKGLTITTDAGYKIVLGDSENMDYKLAVWAQVEADLGREAMSGHVLDLRFGDRPAFQ